MFQKIIILILVLLLVILTGMTISQAKVRQPAQPLDVCVGGSGASFYDGVHISIGNNTIGATLLDQSFPVQREFQLRFATFPSGYSTDNYTVMAWAYSLATGNKLWLFNQSMLHC